MEWIRIEDMKPPEGIYVLARHNRGTWIDFTDQENVNCVVVKLKWGISAEYREEMKSGEKHDYEVPIVTLGGVKKSKRSALYESADEHGNNLKPYCWEQFGPDSFFGQAITHWMEIPKLEKENGK